MKKRALKILAFSIWVVFAVGLAAEGLCRWLQFPYGMKWAPSETAVAHFDPVIGWSYIPNLSKTIRFSSNEMKVYIDSNGIRVPKPDHKFNPSKPSALFIGGSLTMGHGLSYEDSFPGKMADDPNFPLQVVNLGVQAYGTDQSYLALKKYISQFNTKLVIYTYLDSHAMRNGNYDRRTLYTYAKFIGTKPLFKLDKNNELFLKKKPSLYENYRHSWLWDAIKIKLGGKLGLFPPHPMDVTHALIKSMEKICKEKNIMFIVFIWRTGSDPEKLLEDLDVEKIDLVSYVPSGFNDLLIPGDVHPTAEAHGIAAKVLSKNLSNRFRL